MSQWPWGHSGPVSEVPSGCSAGFAVAILPLRSVWAGVGKEQCQHGRRWAGKHEGGWIGKVPGAPKVQSVQEGPLPSSQGSEPTCGSKCFPTSPCYPTSFQHALHTHIQGGKKKVSSEMTEALQQLSTRKRECENPELLSSWRLVSLLQPSRQWL